MTYNNLIDIFQVFAQEHLQVHHFGHGDIASVGEGQVTVYPFLFVHPIVSTIRDNSADLNFNILVMDKVSTWIDTSGNTRNNTRDIMSDCLSIARDLRTYIKDGAGDELDVQGDINITPFQQRFGDEVAGWNLALRVNVEQDDSLCSIPGIGSSLTSNQALIVNTISQLSNYLPLTGGTISGNLTVTGNGEFQNEVDVKHLRIQSTLTGNSLNVGVTNSVIDLGGSVITSLAELNSSVIGTDAINSQLYYSGGTPLQQIFSFTGHNHTLSEITDYVPGGGSTSPSYDLSYFMHSGTTGLERWYSQLALPTQLSTNATMTRDVIRFFPRIISTPLTIDAVRIEVTATGGTNAGNARLAIYDSTNIYPVNKVYEFGEVDISTVGLKEISGFELVLEPGLYWFAMVHSVVTTPTFRATAVGQTANVLGMFHTGGFNQGQFLFENSSYANGLPASTSAITWSISNVATTGQPIIGFRLKE